MAKLETLSDVPGVAPINANNDRLEAALANTLSRDGSSPNFMLANLDMNNRRILNLPTAVSNSEPVTLAQAASIAGVENPLTTESVGAALYPETEAETTAAVTIVSYQYPPGDVRRYGAAGDATTNDTAAFAAALSANKHVTVPAGNYLVSTALTLADDHVIDFEADAMIKAGANSLTVFQSTTTAYYAQVNNPRIDGNGYTGVIAFDLTGWRHQAVIRNAYITRCADGIILKQLCWDAVLENPHITLTTRPITVKDGGNAVLILHPALDTYTTGITIQNGPTHDTVNVRVLGGYIQDGTTGISDTGAYGTIVDGTYFEENTANDIDLSASIRTSIARTQHYLNVGLSCVKARNCDGVTVMDPLMTSGARSTGLFDFDGTNTKCYAFYEVTDSSLNSPAGTVTGLGRIPSQDSGTFTPVIKGSSAAGAGTYSVQSGKYSRTGSLVHFDAELTWSAHTGTGNIVIGGLPAALAPAAYAPRRIARAVFVSGSATGPTIYAYMNGTSTDFSLVEVNTSGVEANIAIDTAATLYVSGSYEL